MPIDIGDQIVITCQSSAYNGVEGVVHGIQQVSRYAMVILPEGTERKLEGIASNVIRTQRAASEKKKPLPPGDPQWFPLEWLAPAPPA